MNANETILYDVACKAINEKQDIEIDGHKLYCQSNDEFFNLIKISLINSFTSK